MNIYTYSIHNFKCEAVHLCNQCNRECKNEKFCSSSCAAKFNNARRTKESREKQRLSLKKYFNSEPKKIEVKLEKEDINKRRYYDRPNICLICNNILEYSIKNKKVCSGICQIKYYKQLGEEKTKICVEKYNKQPNKCVVCKTILEYNVRNNKCCSKTCKNKHHSILMSNRLKNTKNRQNYGRGKKSWLESSFEKWLNDNKITGWVAEKQFKRYNPDGSYKCCYYPDFTFEDIKFIVELDGTQHLKTVEKDKERDEFIFNTYGYEVFRISYEDYQKQIFAEFLKEKLINKMR